MSLLSDLQYLTQIWAVTPNTTSEKARTQLLKVSRYQKYEEKNLSALKASGNFGKQKKGKGKGQGTKEECKYCRRAYLNEKC